MSKPDPGSSSSRKKSPLASKKSCDGGRTSVDFDDNASDQTDGGSEHLDDVIDAKSNVSDPAKTKAAIDQLKQKIDKIKLSIRAEQESKEENVNLYLRSTNGEADKAMLQRHKTTFEKNNQRSAATISQLQKKLEVYQKRIREIEQHGLSAHRPAKDILKDMGQGLKDLGGNLRDNVFGLPSALVAKQRELLLARSKFGSADNINHLPKPETLTLLAAGVKRESPPAISSTLPPNLKMPFLDDQSAVMEQIITMNKTSSLSDGSSTRDGPHANGHLAAPVSHPPHAALAAAAVPTLEDSNAAILEAVGHITSDLDLLKLHCTELQDEVASVKQSFEEERYRCERLEEHLNDMAELYQNELANLKQEVANMEEKLEYQLEERTRDMHEALESCHTKISKMELQSQHQQLINVDSVDNATAKVLVTKLINVVLAILAIILFCISTVTSIINPFINNRWKTVTLAIVVVAVVLATNHWEQLKATLLPGLAHAA